MNLLNELKIASDKVISEENLKHLKGGGEEYITCCVYFDGGELAYSGLSGTGSCDDIDLPEGMYAVECDNI